MKNWKKYYKFPSLFPEAQWEKMKLLINHGTEIGIAHDNNHRNMFTWIETKFTSYNNEPHVMNLTYVLTISIRDTLNPNTQTTMESPFFNDLANQYDRQRANML